MNYLLDTNILIIYGRDSEIAENIERENNFFDGSHNLAISAVTLGELNSLTRQFKWGERKVENLTNLITGVFPIDINIQKIIERYGEIDAFSQGKLEGKPLNRSAINMGKNDLWIAATASVYDLELVTTDKDFEHLDKVFLKLKRLDFEKYKNSGK